jgi:CheY-like chemotaxis protein
VGGEIRVDANEDKLGVTVKISDNGIGIAREMLPTIFDLFAQVDSSMERAQGGLGIGLTLVKNLVEMHKGTVKAESAGKGHGSEFTVRLPIQISCKNEQIEDKPKVSATKSSYRVLIVDDNEASAKTLGWTLEMLGHDIRLAHEGNKAIETAKSYLPHVILLDIGLPGMNGYEICKVLRLFPELEKTVIVAQTGWGQKEHLLRSKEAGFNHHLVKPISIETLEKIFAEL